MRLSFEQCHSGKETISTILNEHEGRIASQNMFLVKCSANVLRMCYDFDVGINMKKKMNFYKQYSTSGS